MKPPSQFTEKLYALIEKWTPVLPEIHQRAFRESFRPLGEDHDQALDLIEDLWKRHEHEYAFDEAGMVRRRPFHEHLVAVLQTPPPGLRAVGVLFLDLNGLKKINDTRGHAAGDAAVAATGAIIREAVRLDRHLDYFAKAGAQEGGDYALSRFGGDEFLVALGLEHPDDADGIARRIKGHVEDVDRQQRHGYAGPPSLSIAVGGVVYALADAPLSSRPAHALAKRLVAIADEQMYESKRDGEVHLVMSRLEESPEATATLDPNAPTGAHPIPAQDAELRAER